MNAARFFADGWTRKYLECCWRTSMHYLAARVSRKMVKAWLREREEKPPDPYKEFYDWCNANGYIDRLGPKFDEAIKAYAKAGGAR